MKCITLLLDGASDRSYAELDHKTPLDYANTPHLDQLAKESQCGLMTVLEEGLVLGTDLAHFLLFGYELKEYPSRTIIDAIGEKLLIDPEAVYLRCSLATVKKENGYLLEERFTADVTDDEIALFIPALKYTYKGFNFEFIHSYDSHGFVKITGKALSSDISDSDPFRTQQYVMAVEAYETEVENAKEMAKAINAFIKNSYDVLSCHEINQKRVDKQQVVTNLVLTKWAGQYQDCEDFSKRNGMTGLLVGQSNLLEGLSSYIGMDYQAYDDFSEGLEMAMKSKADFVHLHSKTPDTASHKKDAFLKVRALEAIDAVIAPLMSFDGLLIVTSDHSTPCAGKNIHSGESVAFMAKGQYIRRDDVSHFNEVACSKGSLHLKGKSFMPYVINAMDRSAMYHLRQGNRKRPYVMPEVNKLV